jgi:alkylation response protein AidB-like acyl-CoA dehydrogenase
MFQSPLREIRFVMHELLDDGVLGELYSDVDYSADFADNIVEEGGKFAENVLEPLNQSGDREGARWTQEGVITPKGFREAYAAYVQAGWAQLSVDLKSGGQGMPHLISIAVEELMFASNMAFYVGTSLVRGAVETISASGNPQQLARILPKMVTGEWMGTMNLTESQAGSDLALLRTRAVAEGDHYRIFGQKIFITYGDHDLTDNIIHLVLARTPDAPEGVKGISLFVVPKVLVKDDGSLGARNDVHCVSIEHKLGIHASPTCVMAYGDEGGATGWLIGEENKGMAAMFTMMNNARLNVGLQGVSIAERATQQAVAYARERVQGSREGRPARIIEFPDVRRMLLRMKALTQAARALTYYCAGQTDRAGLGDDAARARADLLTPLVKAYGTDVGVEVTSLGVQVHGGMGYIEETGAAQHYRDARISPIYEGTNGIQAADLVGRKLGLEGGAVLRRLLADIHAEAGDESALTGLVDDCEKVAGQLLAAGPDDRLAASYPFLTMLSVAVCGWLMARQASALDAHDGDPAFKAMKRAAARFYLDQIVPEARGLTAAATASAEVLYSVDEEAFAA